MPRDLFGDVTRPSISIGDRKSYMLPVSLLSHSAIALILIALPILAPALMPSVFTRGIEPPTIVDLVPPSPPPPPRPASVHPLPNPNAAPVTAPSTITPETPLDLEWQNQPAAGVIGGTDNIEHIIAAPPVVAAPPEPQIPLQVGGTIRRPLKVGGNDPVYPPLARAAGVQGIVIIEATIGAVGQVINARILRSLPLLDQAALDAVRQWQYTPTLLNGVPTPVIMTVTVNFTLR